MVVVVVVVRQHRHQRAADAQRFRKLRRLLLLWTQVLCTGVNPAGDAGDTSHNILVGGRQREYPPNIITYFRIQQTNIGCPPFAQPQADFIRL